MDAGGLGQLGAEPHFWEGVTDRMFVPGNVPGKPRGDTVLLPPTQAWSTLLVAVDR